MGSSQLRAAHGASQALCLRTCTSYVAILSPAMSLLVLFTTYFRSVVSLCRRVVHALGNLCVARIRALDQGRHTLIQISTHVFCDVC